MSNQSNYQIDFLIKVKKVLRIQPPRLIPNLISNQKGKNSILCLRVKTWKINAFHAIAENSNLVRQHQLTIIFTQSASETLVSLVKK